MFQSRFGRRHACAPALIALVLERGGADGAMTRSTMTTRMIRAALLTAALGAVAGAVGAAASQARDAWPPPGSSTGTCRDGRSWTTSEPQHAQMLVELNAVRAAAGRPPLTRHAVLDKMALAHAADMACRNFVEHKNAASERLPQRLARVNDGSIARWRRLAEVIGTSVAPARQVERWLDSRPHRQAVLHREHDRVGIGVVTIAGSHYQTYWAVELMASSP